ncbi:MAG: TetR family transcriptional regulator [Chloroflexota bacterium]
MATQARGEETRSRILDAAAAGFAEQGYEGTSVAHICSRAGVSKGAFYHHFPGKQDLFLELLERWLGVLDQELEALRAEDRPVPQQLLAMTALVRQVFRAAGDQLPVFLEFWTRATYDPQTWEATIAPYRRYRRYFAEIIAAGVAEGTLRPVDPDTAARVVVSLAVGVVVQGLLDAEGADWGAVASRGMEMLLAGIEERR